MDKIELNIAVTGLNNTDNPGPGIPVIRGIRESEDIEARIIGLAYENLEPGIYMKDMVDKTYQVPYPSSGSETYIERIKEIHDKEKIDIIIPNFDAELYTFMIAEKQLNEWGIKLFLPTVKQYEERHKEKLSEFGKKYNILVPDSKSITSLNDIPGLRDDFEYPLLVKGKFYDAYLAYNSEQVINHFNKISAKWGLPVIIQEFKKGTEVNVVALGDGNGNTVAAVPMRKTFITDKGKAWGGITIDDEKLLQLTRKIISATEWKGALELEMIKTNNNEYYLIEINPRIPAWVYLAVGAGQNIPEMLVKLALNKPIEPKTDFLKGKMFIRYSFDLIGDITQFEQLSIFGEL